MQYPKDKPQIQYLARPHFKALFYLKLAAHRIFFKPFQFMHKRFNDDGKLQSSLRRETRRR